MPKPLRDFFPPLPENMPERASFLALTGSVSLSLISIAASQILLAGAMLGAFWMWRKDGASFRPPQIVWPLLFFFLWTVVTAIAAPNIHLGLTIIKKFYIFFILLLVPMILRGPGRLTWAYKCVYATGAIAAAMGVLQFISDPNRDLLHRISGSMSQWMTYSGLLMLVLVALCAYAVCLGRRSNEWVIPIGLLVIASLYLSETRNAWLGAIAGILMVLMLKRPRAIIALLLIVGSLYLFSPASMQRRLMSGFDPNDPNTKNRIELFETSMRLIRDNFWFGVGPKNVGQEALRYRGNYDYPNWMYQHMHNNFLQIAAERGIPGFILWLWFMGRLAWDAIRLFRSARRAGEAEAVMVSLAALGGWAALLVSGLFEYNFGDSEVLTLFLFMMSAPYAIDTSAYPENRSESGVPAI